MKIEKDGFDVYLSIVVWEERVEDFCTFKAEVYKPGSGIAVLYTYSAPLTIPKERYPFGISSKEAENRGIFLGYMFADTIKELIEGAIAEAQQFLTQQIASA